jgi:Zn-dependent protease
MADATTCPGCGTQLAPSLLTCPSCQRLVHADRLRALAEEAGRAASPTEALVAWRSALELLPPTSRQHATVSASIAALGREVDAAPAVAAPRAGGRGWGNAAGLGTLALIAWKAKLVLLPLLAKGKLLVMGLAKLGTLYSMFLSVGVYATAFGWKLAAGLVASIYVHEMGHVAALMRYGVRASAPMFIPGLGALVRLQQPLGDPRQDARVGLAGPVWGLAAALVASLVWLAGAGEAWGAIAKLGATINLFNLMPFGPLDGGRAFRSLTRSQRWFALLALSVCWSASSDEFTVGMLTLVLLVGVIATLGGRPAAVPDQGTLAVYIVVAAVLTYLSGLPVPLPGQGPQG